MADSPDFIPDAQFKPDTTVASATRSPDFIPDDQFVSDEEKYGGVGSKIGTFLEGGLEGATFGLSTALEKKVGKDLRIDALSPENIRGRREANEVEHGVGQVTGIGLTALIPGGGTAGLLEGLGAGGAKAVGLGAEAAALTAGKEAAKAAAKAAAEAGLEKAAASKLISAAVNTAKNEALAGFSTSAKIGSTAVKSAVENMLVQGGDEVSKMFAGNYADPSEAVQTAAVNVGLAGVIGGAFGGAAGSISPLYKATIGKKLGLALGDMGNEAEHLIANGKTEAAAFLPEEIAQRQMLDEAAGQLAPNAEEIKAAHDLLGIKPTSATITDSELARRLESHLSKRATIPGAEVGKEYEKIFEGLRKSAVETLRDATNKTEYEVGGELKEGAVKKLKSIFEPLEAGYKEVEPHITAMEVPEEAKRLAIDPLLSMNNKTATELAMEINALDNVTAAKELRTKIGARINDAVRGGYKGANEELPALYQAKNALTALREQSIEAASKATGIGKKEAGEISAELIDKIRTLDRDYAKGKKLAAQLGVEGSFGKVGGARDLIKKLGNLANEDLPKKFFDLNDVNQLKFMQEQFPQQYELARRYKLKDILEKSIDESQGARGKLNPYKYLDQLKDTKIGPEAKALLLAGHLEKENAIRTVYRSVPGNFNISNTAADASYGHLFTPQGIIDNASDAIKYAVLKRLPQLMEVAGTTDAKATGLAAMNFLRTGQAPEGEAFKSAVDYISQTIKGENLIGKATKGVFKAGEQVLPTKLIPDDKSREKLDKKLKELQTNQTPLFDVGGKTAHYLPEHGTAIASTAMNAVNYLNSLRPVPQKQSPLDSDPVVTKAQTAAFNKALDIAQQPLVVMEDIKNGTISASDIKTLHTVYPALYSRLSDKLNHHMIEAVNAKENIPYKTRMGVSLFLGQPLDSTLKSNSILAAQATFMRPSQQKDQQAKQQQGPGPHSMKGLAKLPAQYATPQQAREASKLKA